jgi:fumarate hydratase subunit beta
MRHYIELPLTREKAAALESGDAVFLTGAVYTARDAAHKRFIELLDAGKPLPFPIQDGVIYYTGPTPASPGRIIGSAGPTTSYRMDAYTPRLLDLGLRAMIGKGDRSPAVCNALRRNGAVYLGATGGAGALLSESIREAVIVAFEDLGTEAPRRFWVEDFPVITIIDSRGNNLYDTGRAAYLKSRNGA